MGWWSSSSEGVASQSIPPPESLNLLFQAIGPLSFVVIQGVGLFEPFCVCGVCWPR